MAFAVRAPGGERELAGLPELVVAGLDDRGARALLAMTMPGCIDERVRERILAEARGNPLALLELHTDLTPADLAGGYGLAEARPLTRRIESSFTTQLRELPSSTRQLLLIAAADPVGSADVVVARRRTARARRGRRRSGGSSGADRRSAPGCISGTRWCARRSTGRDAVADRRRDIRHWPTRSIRDPTYELRAWHRAQAAPDADESVARRARLQGRAGAGAWRRRGGCRISRRARRI